MWCKVLTTAKFSTCRKSSVVALTSGETKDLLSSLVISLYKCHKGFNKLRSIDKLSAEDLELKKKITCTIKPVLTQPFVFRIDRCLVYTG